MTKVTWERELDFSSELVNEMTRGARGELVTLVMDHWNTQGGSQAGPGLERVGP